MAVNYDVVARRSIADVRSLWRVHRNKPAATAVNLIIYLALSAAVVDKIETVALFFCYCFGSDILFGRCLGMTICRTRWVGTPTIQQKLIYNSSYAICFMLLLFNEVTCALIALAQVVSVVSTGKTTHGILANMNSEPRAY